MNGRIAKKLRKAVYGDLSIRREARKYVNFPLKDGRSMQVALIPRARYRAAKTSYYFLRKHGREGQQALRAVLNGVAQAIQTEGRDVQK